MTLRRRLDLTVSVVVLAVFFCVVFVATWHLSQRSLEQGQTTLNATTMALQQTLAAPLANGNRAEIRQICSQIFNVSNLHQLELRNSAGVILVQLNRDESVNSTPDWFRSWFRLSPPHTEARIPMGHQQQGTLTLSGSVVQLYSSLWKVYLQIGAVALLAYVFLILSIWRILRQGFAPLELLEVAAGRLARGIREPLDEEKLPAELRLPVRAFNQMSAQISHLILQLLEKQTDLNIAAQAIESLGEGVVILDREMGAKYYNPYAASLFGQMPDLQRTLVDTLDQHLTYQLDANLRLATIVSSNVAPDDHRTLDILINTARILDQEEIYYVIVIRDITEERNQRSRLAWEATHDTLTGLLNRNEFVQRLNANIAIGEAGMLLMLDLDHFKHINDSYGHSVGDRMIKHIADALSERIGRLNLIARIGGDQFIMLLKDVTQEQGSTFAESLLSEIPSMKLMHSGYLLQLTACIGGIYYDENNQLSAEMLISHTDATLFHAKQNGRNQLAIFAHAMPQLASLRLDQEWMTTLSNALEQGSIVPLFQPMASLHDGSVCHFEALARLNTQTPFLEACEFVPHAERLGLIGEVDTEILRHVLTALTQHPQLTLAANLSGYTLNNPHLRKRVFELLKQHETVTSRLIFEITESTAIDEMHDVGEFIHAARQTGCRFAIDDFGVGYSSLQRLSQLDVDYLKIDGSLLKNLHSENSGLLQAVQGLADALQIPTVAEHVDSEEKWNVLKKIGINFAQGHYVGHPASLSEILDLDMSLARSHSPALSTP